MGQFPSLQSVRANTRLAHQRSMRTRAHTESKGVSTTSRSFSICSLQPPTSEYVTSGFSSTCIIVTLASILGGRGIWIWYLFRSTLERDCYWNGNECTQIHYSPNAHTLLDICRSNAVAQTNDELCDLLNINHILRLFVCTTLALDGTSGIDCACSFSGFFIDWDDLCTPCDLEDGHFSHALLVNREVPEVWRGETSIRFLNT